MERYMVKSLPYHIKIVQPNGNEIVARVTGIMTRFCINKDIVMAKVNVIKSDNKNLLGWRNLNLMELENVDIYVLDTKQEVTQELL